MCTRPLAPYKRLPVGRIQRAWNGLILPCILYTIWQQNIAAMIERRTCCTGSAAHLPAVPEPATIWGRFPWGLC